MNLKSIVEVLRNVHQRHVLCYCASRHYGTGSARPVNENFVPLAFYGKQLENEKVYHNENMLWMDPLRHNNHCVRENEHTYHNDKRYYQWKVCRAVVETDPFVERCGNLDGDLR